MAEAWDELKEQQKAAEEQKKARKRSTTTPAANVSNKPKGRKEKKVKE